MINVLTPIRRKSSKTKVAVFDIEAKDWIKFKIAGHYDGATYREFRTVKELVDCLLSRQYRGWNQYAHFGGRYDFLFILDELLDRAAYDIEICDAGSRILFLKIRDTAGHLWKLVDSYSILPASLDSITRAFGVEHKKKKFDIGRAKFDKRDMSIIRDYLKFDCIGLWESLEKFKQWGLNGGVLSLTLALQALYVFRSGFLSVNIPNLARDKEDFIRAGYFGGRVEIFKLYGEGLNYYDVNSLYPAMMLEDMPVGNPLRTSRFQKGKIGFYKARVDYPLKIYAPNLPVKTENKLYFPTGTLPGYYASCELEAAARRGAKIKIFDGCFFPKQAPIFRDYVKATYRLKKNSEPGSMDYFLSKLLMNSLYGKFGQRRERSTIISSMLLDAADEGLRPYLEQFGLYIKESESKANFIIPSIASWITAKARAFLYDGFLDIGERHIYYCDTDSIITDRKLDTGEGLGEWKAEYENFKGVFLQPKMYALKKDKEEVVKAKGYNNPNFSFSDFEYSLFHNDYKGLVQSRQRLTGYREGLRRFGKALNLITMEKRFIGRYDKRKILKNFDTKPLTLDKSGHIIKAG